MKERRTEGTKDDEGRKMKEERKDTNGRKEDY
jgi:hypothetical protein